MQLKESCAAGTRVLAQSRSIGYKPRVFGIRSREERTCLTPFLPRFLWTVRLGCFTCFWTEECLGCLIEVVYDLPEWSVERVLESPVSICCGDRRVEFPSPLGFRMWRLEIFHLCWIPSINRPAHSHRDIQGRDSARTKFFFWKGKRMVGKSMEFRSSDAYSPTS